MSTNYTVQINDTEFIGDSLIKINTNTSNLDTTCATLSTALVTLIRGLTSAAFSNPTTYSNFVTTLSSNLSSISL